MTEVVNLKTEEPAVDVAFSPDGQWIATTADNAVLLWNWQSNQQHLLEGHEDWVVQVCFLLDGKLASVGEDHTIRVWDIQSKKALASLQRSHTGEITPLSGTTLASAEGREIKLWDWDKQWHLGSLKHQAPLTPLAYWESQAVDATPMLASGSLDGQIKLYNLSTQKEMFTLESEDMLHSLAFSPDGKTLVSGGLHGLVRVWDLEKRTLRGVLKGHQNSIECVEFCPQGKLIASASVDCTVRLWEWASQQTTLLKHKGEVFGIAFSPDGRLLASGGYDGVRVWQTA